MNKRIQGILHGVGFSLGLLLLLAGLSRVMEYKGSREKLAPFFARADQIDVLFLGDSHAYSGVYPMELFAAYGITAYNLASYNATLPVSYWMLQNALERCTPKVVVLDVNQIWADAKVPESSADVHTALDAFPLGRVKRAAIEDLLDDPALHDKDGLRYRDLRWEFYLPFLKYHARWNDLGAEDFVPEPNRELGAERNIAVAAPAAYEITASAADEDGYGFAYLRRLVAQCQAAGIRVLLTNLPYPCPNNNGEQLYTNAVAYTAEELGVEYLDFVYMDKIVDYGTDCYDPASHLNPSGAWKVTDFLGRTLAQAYALPDHREDAAYDAWHADYARYREDKLQSFVQETDPYSFLMLLADPSFSALVLLPEGSASHRDPLAMQLLQNAGRRHLMPEDVGEAVWSDALYPLSLPGSPEQAALALIDRQRGAVSELRGAGTAEASFGSVSLREDGVLSLSGTDHASPDADLYALLLDPQTGAVLYDRSIVLPKGP